MKGFLLGISVFFLAGISAQNIRGKVTDIESGEGIQASVFWKGSPVVVNTDSLGNFTLSRTGATKLVVQAKGYSSAELEIPQKLPAVWLIQLSPESKQVGVVNITHDRQKEKIRESPVTVESQSAQTIKQTPASDFYEGLGHLRGVDVTAASMGFRIVNTRGFNSTSPVRSLQMIDGVDNQAPGLNFSLGNFLGASELDVQQTEIIVGASSAYYGPNAFNGVIKMTTKSPWTDTGLSAQLKVGERQLGQVMLRYAQAYKNKKGRDVFAWKVNISYLRAYDWVADNKDAVTGTGIPTSSMGGYDAVNRYGDEKIQKDFSSLSLRYQYPGLENFTRTGYWEKDLVNYNTRNLKSSVLLAWKLNPKNELQVASNFGTGTTVYQGDNRYSLNDIIFFQHRVELIGKKGFLRTYLTHEDAGNTYDAVLTAIRMQDLVKADGDWLAEYAQFWADKNASKVRAMPGYPTGNPSSNKNWLKEYLAFLENQRVPLQAMHDATRTSTDKGGYFRFPYNYTYPTYDFFKPGTARFDSLKNAITSRRSFDENGNPDGSRFYDRSSMLHLTGERRFSLREFQFITGFSARMYQPNSKGTVFQDRLEKIINKEAGAYAGVEKRFYKNRFKTNVTARLDKNQNFNFLFSPAASVVYSKTKVHTWRTSISSALRNPTLQDQYLHYNVGRAILLGNVNGIKNVVELDSFKNYIYNLDTTRLHRFNLPAIKPEQVRTFEIAYKGILFHNRLLVDAGYYYSLYHNFIGYKLLVGDLVIDAQTRFPLGYQVYRIAANSKDKVSTQGFSIGLNYFFSKSYMVTGNWSWNKLNRKGSTDPLIPAFNTPANKFNIGFGGIKPTGKISVFGQQLHFEKYSFNINYKWIEGFRYEGSPQFTGDVPSYWLLDAQISRDIERWKSVLKIGCSNITNNMVYQVYGGPRIGRMAYASLTLTL